MGLKRLDRGGGECESSPGERLGFLSSSGHVSCNQPGCGEGKGGGQEVEKVQWGQETRVTLSALPSQAPFYFL